MVTHQPFAFPAKDNYALRGMIASPPEQDPASAPESVPPSTPAQQTPSRPRPSSDSLHRDEKPKYNHPFTSPPREDRDRRPWEPAPASPLPFGLSARQANANRWKTRNRKPPPSSRGVVIINGAVGIPSGFYRSFAAALADAHFTVITYDYRGIGNSRPRSLKTFDATLTDWILLDMAAAIDWSTDQYPTDRLFLVGHSFGGQTAGLLDNASSVRAMAAVASQSGYWKDKAGKERRRIGMHMRFTVPTMARLSGYMPGSRFGSGEDLPKGAALQWAKWSTDPMYLLGDDTLPIDRYSRFTAPVLSYTFTDDPSAPIDRDDPMMAAYPNVTHRRIDPPAVGLDAIGQLGYFNESSRSLWPELIEWFDEQ